MNFGRGKIGKKVEFLNPVPVQSTIQFGEIHRKGV